MGYTKQNFIKGQILKADHLNAMETGIEANDAAVAALSKEMVKSVNGVEPDENGNVAISGDSIVIDSTLTISDAAADAKAVGEAVSQLSEEIDEFGEVLKDAQGYFEASGAIISTHIDKEVTLKTVSKIGHDGLNIGYSVAKLQISGPNIIDFSSLWPIEETETKDGIDVTYHADGTVTLNGTHSTTGWSNIHVATISEDDRIIYPAGTYYLPTAQLPTNCGIMVNATYADGSGTMGNYTRSFVADKPFYIQSTWVVVRGSVSFENVNFDAAIYPGSVDLDDPVYVGKTYLIEFGQDVYGGTYDWNSGLLTVTDDADGELEQPAVYQLLAQDIKSIAGINCIFSTCGDNTHVAGYAAAVDSSGGATEYSAEVGEYAQIVSAKQNQQTLTIGVLTDTHVDFTSDNQFTNRAYFNDMHKCGDYFNQDIIANLGDILTLGYTDKVQPLDTLRKFAFYFNDPMRNTPIAVLRGNHDDNCYGVNDDGQQVNTSVDAIITPLEWSNICARLAYPYAVFPAGKTDAAYFYMDNERTKIRTIMINTEDFPYEVVDGVVQHNSYYDSVLSPEQLQFVADALQFDGKDDPDDWAVVVLSHRPLDMTIEEGKRIGDSDGPLKGVGILWGIIDAWRTRTDASGTTTDGDYTYVISADYTSKTKNGEFICCIAGHTHTDNVSNAVGNTTDKCYGYTFITVSTKGPVHIAIDRDAQEVNVCKMYGRNAYVYSHAGLVGNIRGLSSSGESEWETVDADGCFKTQWTKL